MLSQLEENGEVCYSLPSTNTVMATVIDCFCRRLVLSIGLMKEALSLGSLQ